MSLIKCSVVSFYAAVDHATAMVGYENTRALDPSLDGRDYDTAFLIPEKPLGINVIIWKTLSRFFVISFGILVFLKVFGPVLNALALQ
jgi:hypothetical protein